MSNICQSVKIAYFGNKIDDFFEMKLHRLIILYVYICAQYIFCTNKYLAHR